MKRVFTMCSLVVCLSVILSGSSYSQDGRTLHEIRQAIEESGAQWTARQTPLTDLSPEEKRLLCGTILETPEGPFYEPDWRFDPPPQLDWRDHLGSNWTTPVRDQGQCGSCWAFGGCAAFEARYGIVRNDPFIQLDLSEQFMVSCSPGSCGGYSVSGTMSFLAETGTTDEECYPYAARDLPCENACPDWESRLEKLENWQYVMNDPLDIMEALQDGPLTAAFTVYDDFFSYSGGVYEHVWGGNPGGHMVAIYGYNAEHDPPYWICKNSWGYNWGMEGWFYIAWGECGIDNQVTTLFLDVANIVQGTITEPVSGDSIAGARIEILETGQFTHTRDDGSYHIGSLSDTATLVISHYRHVADTSEVLALGDSVTVFDAELSLLPTSSIGGLVLDTHNSRGVRSRVILRMNGQPIDSVYSELETGYYEFTGMPVSNPPYTAYTGFDVRALIPYPATTEYEEDLVLTEGSMLMHVLELPPARICLVDDDEGMTYEEYYLPEVEATGLSYYHFDVHAQDTSAVDYLPLFPPQTLVIWFTGDAAESTITMAEEEGLTEFLENGGKLILTGQNIAEDLSERTSPFLSDVLHVAYDGTSPCAFLGGTTTDLLGGEIGTIVTVGTQGAGNQTSRDILLPLDELAHECMFYATSPIDTVSQGTGAVWVEDHDGGAPRAVFLGYGLEGVISGNPSSMGRDELLHCLLDHFEMIPVGVDEEDDAPLVGGSLPRVFAMQQNYPNPFNPSTTIRFDIPESAAGGVPVTLEIFNLRGQRIRTLIDEHRGPGSHSAQWNGRNDYGESVSSGVYFYRVTAGKFSSIRKMVLLK